ncbi:MAG TPA: hypothetical protein VII82_01940, partial [Polyangiaceae bacterium]
RFLGEVHARGWLGPFFGWHNEEHHHSGLALFTPADVFFARVDQIRAIRQAALDEAYRIHPERFPRGALRVALPPREVSINPMTSTAVALVDDTRASAEHVLGHEVSAPKDDPSAEHLVALASGTSQRDAITVARRETSLGALPATTLRAARNARRQDLHS